MRTKNFVVSLFLLFVALFLTGCGTKSIGKDFQEAQRIATDFLTIKGFEIPKDYKISYANQEHTRFYVNHKNFRVECTTDGELVSIKDGHLVITSYQIERMKKIANDFLSTIGYLPESGYSLEYNYKEGLLEVKEVKYNAGSHIATTITITFDVLKEELTINDISYRINYVGIKLKFKNFLRQLKNHLIIQLIVGIIVVIIIVLFIKSILKH